MGTRLASVARGIKTPAQLQQLCRNVTHAQKASELPATQDDILNVCHKLAGIVMDQADAFSVIEQAAWESDRLIETMGLHINELESALAAAQVPGQHHLA